MGKTNNAAPAGFKTLDQVDRLATQTVVSVIGVVVDYLEPTATKGPDWSIQFGLLDPTFLSPTNQSSGFKVRYFAARDRLPKITGLGDIVLLRSIKRMEWSGMGVLLSSHGSHCLTFSASAFAGKTSITPTHVVPPGVRGAEAAEQNYMFQLRKWAAEVLALSTSGYIPPQPAPLTQRKEKFALLKDAKDDSYCDIMGEVVKIFAGGIATVYLTDYTTNDDFFRYEKKANDDLYADGDEHGYTASFGKAWKGPLGQMTIQLSLWHPHNYFVIQNVKEKDIVFIKNVRMLKSHSTGHLEGKVRTNQKQPDELYLRLVNSKTDRRYLDLLERRAEYYEKEGKPVPMSAQQLSKAQKKKKRQAEKRKAQQQDTGAEKKIDTGATKTSHISGPTIQTNTHVASANPDFTITPISLILSEAHRKHKTPGGHSITLPFVNRKCKIRVRMVDFFPHKLKEFAHCVDDAEYNNMPEPSQPDDSTFVTDIDMSTSTPRRWEWSFFLLVEDASRTSKPAADYEPERLRVLVSNQDAEYLLKTDAKDLRTDKAALNALREKLFILWGDLEEVKLSGQLGKKKPDLQPFDCWIKEYGIPNEDGSWERMFALTQTTIK